MASASIRSLSAQQEEWYNSSDPDSPARSRIGTRESEFLQISAEPSMQHTWVVDTEWELKGPRELRARGHWLKSSMAAVYSWG